MPPQNVQIIPSPEQLSDWREGLGSPRFRKGQDKCRDEPLCKIGLAGDDEVYREAYTCSREAQSWLDHKPQQKKVEDKPPGSQPVIQHDDDTKPSRPATVLHEDIYTLPNILTFTRLVAAPVIGYLVLHDQHAWAVGLFAYAGVTDLLDGWIARRWDSKTVVGTVIDPMADKTLMTILTICLAAKGALPIWCAGIILGRDVGLAISAIYYRWISLPPPKTFARYWDFSLPSAEVRPTTISKYNTFLQLALVGVTTAAPLLSTDLSSALTVMQYVVAATTIWSGASYIYTKDAVKILNKQNSKKP
ncbi:CDP-diacylglycerol-glycerol-3-phosphate 3-phosphatidyltransferase [Fusarium circinatum]|uniref:CDP-diacylglycerol-glycerol-3-phosphate 3-phosphatidyltransferase n=1 Tax=Fusarium circinatum TaxID=48490 RepID=A0A8H5UAT4_FUSCI|nr:CDP-diacylglycerol-glycerol-3-phosphate 3-phosphatidyltransferase [Fusarium circinatum]